MQIQINTDQPAEDRQQLVATVEATVANALQKYREQVTRVEVHISDENGGKGGADDKRCMMEARLEGRPPLAVTHHASTVDSAVLGAAHRLRASLDHAIGRLRRRDQADGATV